LNLLSPEKFFNTLSECDINFFSGVPDSLLKDFCYFVDDQLDSQNHIIAANEGSALALGIGYHLATGKIPLIYLQNSGLGNLVNPLISLNAKEVYSIPGILLIGWRGEPDVNDEPQHKKQGLITLDLLSVLDIPYKILDPKSEEKKSIEDIHQCIKQSKNESRVCALVVKKGFFQKYSQKKDSNAAFPLTRELAIETILDNSKEDDLFVSTTGLPSRELYELRDRKNQSHSRDFLVVGGMGHANQIALGISLSLPKRRIFCLDGDGAIIMHMGSITSIGTSGQENLVHIVLNNGAHDSVGGQQTVGMDINFAEIAKNSGYKGVISISTIEEIKDVVTNIENLKKPLFIEIKVKKGWRTDIGRPTTTPEQNKKNFMLNLSE